MSKFYPAWFVALALVARRAMRGKEGLALVGVGPQFCAMRDDLRLDAGFAALLAGSFQRLVGRALAEVTEAAWLYGQAPFCLLAHDGAADPCFIYANVSAQKCFGYGWGEFVGMASRLSAEAPERGERERLLEAVRRDGFIADYRGVRVRKDGRRFLIEGAVVWELVDGGGVRFGQAAMFWAGRGLVG